MAEPFHCDGCGKPLDLATVKLAPQEAVKGDVCCLLCFHMHTFGTEAPTQEQYDAEGWEAVEVWQDLPTRTDRAIKTLGEFRDQLPIGHAERAGVIRAIEVLAQYSS